jgi:hypothetical protein
VGWCKAVRIAAWHIVIRTLTMLCALYGTGRQNSPPFGPTLNHLYPACTVAPFLKILFQYCHTVYVSYFPHDQGLLRLSETIRSCRAALFGGPRKRTCTSYLVPDIDSYVSHSILLLQYDGYFGPKCIFALDPEMAYTGPDTLFQWKLYLNFIISALRASCPVNTANLITWFTPFCLRSKYTRQHHRSVMLPWLWETQQLIVASRADVLLVPSYDVMSGG